MPVVNTLKAFVDEKDITIYQFCKKTGIALNTGYNLYNNPEQRPSPSVIEKICDYYECQPCELMKWIKKNDSKQQ